MSTLQEHLIKMEHCVCCSGLGFLGIKSRSRGRAPRLVLLLTTNQPIIVKFVSLESNPSMPFSHLGKFMGCSRINKASGGSFTQFFISDKDSFDKKNLYGRIEKANFKGYPSLSLGNSD